MSPTLLGQIILAVLVLATAVANRRKVNEVHVLVNSKMQAALAKIKRLEKQLKELRAQLAKEKKNH